MDSSPIVENGRTLVPIRFIAEALGATVEWNQEKKSVYCVYNSTELTIVIGSKIAVVNGDEVVLDVSSKIINNRTMVPIRFISECFGSKVLWNGEKQEIRIFSDEMIRNAATEFASINYKVGDSLYDRYPEIIEYGIPWEEVYIKPSKQNTGVIDEKGLLLKNGIIRVNEDDTIIENLDLEGVITINASNVIIRNCKITPEIGSYYGINIYNGSNILIEDCEFDLGICLGAAAVAGDNYTLLRSYIHDSGGDGVKLGSNVTIDGCYFEKLGKSIDAHADGSQLSAGTNVIITRSFFNMPSYEKNYSSTSNFMIKADLGVIDNVLIEYNWCSGGGFVVYIVDGPYSVSNVIVRNNKFYRTFKYGLLSVNSEHPYIWDNNVWEDSNILIPDNL